MNNLVSASPGQLSSVGYLLEKMEGVMTLAKFLCKSELLPIAFRNKPENTFILLTMADKLNEDYFDLSNHLNVIHGRTTFGAPYAIRRANLSGKLVSGIQYRQEGQGADLKVTAYAHFKSSPEREISHTVTLKQARQAGWGKGGSQYDHSPDLMLKYRSATFLIRTHMPEVLCGMHTTDEAYDIAHNKGALIDVTPPVEAIVAPSKNKIIDLTDDFLESETVADYKMSTVETIEAADDYKMSVDYKMSTPAVETKTSDVIIESIEVIEEPIPIIDTIQGLIKELRVPQETVNKWLERAQVGTIQELPLPFAQKVFSHLHGQQTKRDSLGVHD